MPSSRGSSLPKDQTCISYVFCIVRWFLTSLMAQRVKSACNAGDLGLIPGLGISPGEGNDNPLQYSSLENPTDGGA